MAAPRSRQWRDLDSRSIGALDRERTVVVLPVAAIEQHGPHLPVSVDTTIVEGLIAATVDRLAPESGVVFLPVMPVGKSNEHARYPGTLTLSTGTALALWQDIAASVAAAGFRRLVILNSHGGHTGLIDIAARDLRERHGLLVAKCHWYQLGLPEGLFTPGELKHGIHAGDIETSMMLALAPHLVDMTRAADFVPLAARLERDFPHLMRDDGGLIGWQMQDLHPAGAAGDATRASAAKGRQVIDHVAGRMVEFLDEVARFPLSCLDNVPNR